MIMERSFPQNRLLFSNQKFPSNTTLLLLWVIVNAITQTHCFETYMLGIEAFLMQTSITSESTHVGKL
jgi:hypothetical protein